MEQFSVTILGCGSATPSPKHFTSAQTVQVRGKLFLVDCGEATQIQLRRQHVAFAQINHIFISHLHGDHCFGLMGVISSFGLLGRTAPLFVHAPKELEKILQAELGFFCGGLEFSVEFLGFETNERQVIYDDRSLSVETIPLKHSIKCAGFLFREKPTADHLDRASADYYGVPQWDYNRIKEGGDFTLPDGTVIPHSRLTKPADKARSYAYCCDTAYKPGIVPQIQGVNLLYHDATYLDPEKERAAKYLHSTALQAAQIARQAEAGKLVLGHFSARYTSEEEFLTEAQPVFENTILAKEGLTITI